jgi:hypothetical protein
MRIFYSWQSDLPNRTNRGLIEEALRRALDQIQRDGEIEVVPVLDRDTQGAAGAPDIARTIFEKIDQAEVFVADATIINRKAIDEYGMRATPNPNVLVELGYAAHSLGWDRIIVVVNTAHGAIEELPFDFRARRVVTYRFADEDKPAMARQELVGKLAGAIGPILGQGPTRRASGPDVSLQWREPPPDRRHPLDIHSESPFAPLDAGRLVLPAPLFADIDTFWGFFAAEERRFAEERQGRAAFGFGGQDSQHFRDFLADPARFVDWYIYTHWRHGVVRAHLDLTNMGTTPAHNIDVRIELPPWLRSTHAGQQNLDSISTSWPFRHYEYEQYSYAHCHVGHTHTGGLPSYEPFFALQEDRSMFERHGRILTGRHPELLHTYTLPSRWPLYLVALPGAPTGPYDLEYEVFCREFSGRQRRKLRLQLMPAGASAAG